MKARRQSIQAPADTALTVFELPPEAFGCPFHFHPEAELVFISKGRGLRLIGDHLEAFRAGDLCLIGPDLPHFYRADEGVEAAALVAQFPVEPLTRLAAGFPEMNPVVELLHRAGRGLVFTGADAARLHAIFDEKAIPRRLPRFLDLLLELASAPARPLASESEATRTLRIKDDRIARVCEHIFAHYNEPLPHARLAALAGLSPAAFSRRFKEITGLNSSRFINRVRLGHCARELRETEQTVAEIAFAAGFENLSNFNRRFREHYACSPRSYRTKIETEVVEQ